MAKKKVIRNETIDPLRENYDWIERSIEFSPKEYNFDKSEYTQQGRFSFPANKLNLVSSMFGQFGQYEYHNSNLSVPTKPSNDILDESPTQFYEANSVFNYVSDPYERIILEESEIKMPNFYIEFINENNKKYASSKALVARRINKIFFDNIDRFQSNLLTRSSVDTNRLRRIIIGDYHDSRDFAHLKDFPYYNKILFNELDDEVITKYLKELDYQEHFVNSSLDRDTSLMVFNISRPETTDVEALPVPTTDLMSFLKEINSSFGGSNSVVLQDTNLNLSDMENNFKRHYLLGFIEDKSYDLIKGYEAIFNDEKCKVENVFFKVEKFLGTTGEIPLQTYFLPASKEIYQIIDTQIKIDTSYSYRVKNVFIIYGTKYKLLAHQIGAITGIAEFTIVSSPSYKMLEMELLRQTVIVKPTPQLSPSPMFFNKSNSKNEIGIYLDLRSGTEYLKPIQVNSTDLTDLENDKKYEYSTQQGVFEVFRIDKKPTSYDDFADQKLMDVQNSMNSTSVSFKDYILPNVKYYYIFRSLNTSLDPSNPTQVYQVELLKDSDDSKISVSTYDFSKEKNYLNRTFKRLIQIKPSFQQSVFDDTKNNVESMSTFKNNLDKLSLGYANHGIWGRKFKIRVKSTDSGKIIDFNIKFKLSIKKTKEDLE